MATMSRTELWENIAPKHVEHASGNAKKQGNTKESTCNVYVLSSTPSVPARSEHDLHASEDSSEKVGWCQKSSFVDARSSPHIQHQQPGKLHADRPGTRPNSAKRARERWDSRRQNRRRSFLIVVGEYIERRARLVKLGLANSFVCCLLGVTPRLGAS